MPDLGAYAGEVLLAYGVTLVLLAGIVGLSVRQARRIARTLRDTEGGNDGA